MSHCLASLDMSPVRIDPVMLPDYIDTDVSDYSTVLRSVTITGSKLQFAPIQYQSNFQIVVTAVSQNGLALKWASKNLKNDHTIVRRAVYNNPKSIRYAGEQVKSDAPFLCPFIKNIPELWSMLDFTFRKQYFGKKRIFLKMMDEQYVD